MPAYNGLLTSGCALIIACLLVLCGSSVYVQKKSSCELFFVEAHWCSSPPAGALGALLSWFVAVVVVTDAVILLLTLGCAAKKYNGGKDGGGPEYLLEGVSRFGSPRPALFRVHDRPPPVSQHLIR